MPGLVGFVCAGMENPAAKLDTAVESLRHGTCRVEPPFVDARVAASRAHLGVLDSGSPHHNGSLHVWVHGEVHNLAAAADACDLEATSLAEALARAAQRDRLPKLVEALDGIFAAALYDDERRQVRLVTDRLGVHPLYVWHRRDRLAWAGELKAFFGLPGFSRDALVPDAFSALMKVGHMVGDLTWFRDVRLLPAASICTYDVDPARHAGDERYWTWADIPPLELSFEDAAAALRDAIATGVRDRLDTSEDIGISLSGGMDSRAILAVLGDRARGLPTFTLGQSSSRDLRYGREVAKRLRTRHQEWLLDRRNWCRGRARAVWKIDGMASVRHNHYTPFHRQLGEACRINLNGYLGDALLGTSYLGDRPRDQRIDRASAEALYGDLVEHDDPADPFYDAPHAEPFLVNNRGRRLIALGSVEIATTVENRKPLIDRRVLELVFGLPDAYRERGLYEAALLKLSAELFSEVPCQTTGRSVTGHEPKALKDEDERLRRSAPTGTRPFPLGDYDAWIRDAPFLSAARSLLDSESCLMREYVERDFSRHLELHAQCKKRYMHHVMRAVTIEIWLRLLHERPLPGVFGEDFSAP